MVSKNKMLASCILLIYAASVVFGVSESKMSVDEAECGALGDRTWDEEDRKRENKLQVKFLLLTRSNIDCAQRLTMKSLSQSYFNASRPTKVIVHGYRLLGSKLPWLNTLAQTLLKVQDVNVLLVDWARGSSLIYNLAVENHKEVAVQIAAIINELWKRGCDLKSVHFIGVSLGAHIAGFVGTLFGGNIGRITALDPAGPKFKGADKFDRLDPSDALFVDAIHTDTNYLGISSPVGHVDFFLNGGKNQVGCSRSKCESMYEYMICDHMRAVHVYISALNDSCPLAGIPCGNFIDFKTGQCRDCDIFNGTCPTIGLSKNSGIPETSPLPKEQIFFLFTTSMAPYCAHHIFLVLKVRPLDKMAEVEVTLIIDKVETQQKFKLRTGITVYEAVMSHPAALSHIQSIQLKNLGHWLYMQRNVHVQSVCVSQIPTLRQEQPLCVHDAVIGQGTAWSHDLEELSDTN